MVQCTCSHHMHTIPCFVALLQVTLPVRFICKTIHLIAVLTVVFDVESVVRNMEMIDTSTTSSRFQLDLFKQRKQE